MKKVQPLGSNVLVRVIKNEKITESGIVIPDTVSEEKSQEGIVVAIGESEEINPAIKENVVVLFKKYSGHEIEIEGDAHVILDAKDEVLAIIR